MEANVFGEIDPKTLRIKAQEAVNRKKDEAKNLRQEWSDSELWRTLASKAGIRLAPYYAKASERKYLNRVLKAIDRDYDWWKENFADSLKVWDESNPNTPAWVLQGMVLEAHFHEKGELIVD